VQVFALGASIIAASQPVEEGSLGLPATLEGVPHDIVVTTDDGTKKVRDELYAPWIPV
jgi:hypothetical protein